MEYFNEESIKVAATRVIFAAMFSFEECKRVDNYKCLQSHNNISSNLLLNIFERNKIAAKIVRVAGPFNKLETYIISCCQWIGKLQQ